MSAFPELPTVTELPKDSGESQPAESAPSSQLGVSPSPEPSVGGTMNNTDDRLLSNEEWESYLQVAFWVDNSDSRQHAARMLDAHEQARISREAELVAALEARDELLAQALYPPPAQGWEQWRQDVLIATREPQEAASD